MATAMNFFVESEGIKLPDGSVFGAGVTHEYDVLRSENRPDAFTVYQYIGKERIPVTENTNWTYRQMREWVHEQVQHYESCGMKLWIADHSEWNKAKVKELVTMDW